MTAFVSFYHNGLPSVMFLNALPLLINGSISVIVSELTAIPSYNNTYMTDGNVGVCDGRSSIYSKYDG